MHIPYTYLLGWSKQNKFYYGVRYSKDCQPQDLWVTYFTSSAHVKRFCELHGDPDIIQIRKTFQSRDLAILWESRVLCRILPGDAWINKTNNKAIWYVRTPEQVKSFSDKMKGRVSPFKGRTHTEESKQSNRLKHIGKKTGRKSSDFTEEWKHKISISNKGRVRIQSEDEKTARKKQAANNGFSKNAVGKIWINNGLISKRISPEQAEAYPGFVRGRIVAPSLP